MPSAVQVQVDDTQPATWRRVESLMRTAHKPLTTGVDR
jgi:hypothetical protein